MGGKQFAEKKYPGQKTWIHIAANAFNEGYQKGTADQKKKDADENTNLKELQELREYKREMEDTIYDPERLADLIAGL